jgi:hypothetical protein
MADNARFHNKLHRKNHHTVATPGYPDSGTDPIASPEEPFQGLFVIDSNNQQFALSAHGDVVIDGSVTIRQNLSAYGEFVYFETLVSVTSALSVVNTGTGPALTIVQTGRQPIARFIDGDADALSGRYALYINDQGQSIFGWDSVGPVASLSAFQFGIIDNKNQPFLIEEYSAADGVTLRGLRSRGDVTSPAGVSANDVLIGLRGFGRLFGGRRPTTDSSGAIDIIAAETFTNTRQGTYITFVTTPTGFNSVSRIERMRITPEGYVGINETRPMQTLTVRGTVSATNGLSAYNGYFIERVGINENRPIQTLTVRGTISATEGLSAFNGYFIDRVGINENRPVQTLTVRGTISATEGLSAFNGYFIDRVGINEVNPQHTLSIRGTISASAGLSAYHGSFLDYVSANEVRAYYTNTKNVTAKYLFGFENEAIFTSLTGNDTTGNGDRTLTINYTNGLYVSSAPIHFPLALTRSTALIFGRDNDTNLYRSAPDNLRTDGIFAADGLSGVTLSAFTGLIYSLSAKTLTADAGYFNNLLSGGDLIVDMLTARSPNYNRLASSSWNISAIASDPLYHYYEGRIGINTRPLSTYALHIKGGNIRVDGVDFSQIGIPGQLLSGAFDTDAQSLFDLRSGSVGANYSLSIAESGVGQFLKFFGGRTGDAQAFINTKQGTPLRFGTFDTFYGTGYREHMRVGGNGNIAIGYNVPHTLSFTNESTDKLGVSGDTFIFGSISALGTTSRPSYFNQNVGIKIINPPADLTVAGSISATRSLSAGQGVFSDTLFARNSAFVGLTLSAAILRFASLQNPTQTFSNPATATGEFLVLNINGNNRAIRLWEYTS